MKEILLTQGKVAIVDSEDYEWLSQWKWQYHEGYATTAIYNPDGQTQTRVWMHRLIMDCPDDMVVDHRDGNGLNNFRSNLRVCTPNQNKYNQRPQEGRLSIYKGVTVRDGKYIARISKDETLYHIGVFTDEIASANAYNHYALQYFGEFARLNEVEYMAPEEWGRSKVEISRSSKYTGVSLDKKCGRFASYLWVKKKKHFLGYFDNEVDAVTARNKKVIELGLSESKLQGVVL